MTTKTTESGGGNHGDQVVEVKTFGIPKDWKTMTVEIPQTTSPEWQRGYDAGMAAATRTFNSDSTTTKTPEELLAEIRMIAIDPFKTDEDKLVFIQRLFGIQAELKS